MTIHHDDGLGIGGVVLLAFFLAMTVYVLFCLWLSVTTGQFAPTVLS
jgi:hypothetical protein